MIDPWGNLQASGNFSFIQQYNPATNQISASGYVYDAAGELTNDGNGNTYTYDRNGMLTASNGAQYVYDALDQRIEKTIGGNSTISIYFQGRRMAELNPATKAWTDLIWDNQAIVAEVGGTRTALPEYRLLGHLGSLAVVTDGSGNPMETNVLTPYGQLTSISSYSVHDPFLFAGLEQDTENASDHGWYRNYSTEQNRWLSPDPYNGSYDIANPQSFNRYSYVMNNPLMFTDPSGRDPFTITVYAICGGVPGACAGVAIDPVTAAVLGGLLAGAELGNLLGWWGGPQFQGSLKPRPKTPCMNAPKSPPGASASANLATVQQATQGMDPVSKLGYVDQTFKTGGLLIIRRCMEEQAGDRILINS